MTVASPTHGSAGLRLADNIVRFVRLLRAAGMKLGPASASNAVAAVRLIDIGERRHFYHALAACLINRPEDRALFDQAFAIFWRNPEWMHRVRGMLLPQIEMPTSDAPDQDAMLRRLQDALGKSPEAPEDLTEMAEDRVEVDSSMTFSDEQTSRTMDFQMMSAEELHDAERAVDALDMPALSRPSRRFRPMPTGRVISFRRTLQQMTRRAGLCLPVRETRRQQPRPNAAICDISGSMDRYSRILLRFTHALTQKRHKVHSFLFGTRLTNVSHAMRDRDADQALANVAAQVDDWSGGTRICNAIRQFNSDWSRRVLGQGAVVLLITDGLDRDDGDLELEIERLHKSCSKLIWLNPLLRFGGFEPKGHAVQKILPHVDAFLPVHSLASMADLATVLSQSLSRNWRHKGMPAWLHRLDLVKRELVPQIIG